MMNSKVFVINNIYGEIEIFSSLDELIFMGWGDHYPTVQEAIASEWKVGVTPLSNIKNIRKEVKYTANLGVIDPDYDWYTDLPVQVTKGDIIDPNGVFYIPNKIYTHAGVFHADETFGVALIRQVNSTVKVERAFTAPETTSENEIIIDIGGGQYDHHQEKTACRPDGGKRAACGLVWEEVKDLLFKTEDARDRFERSYIIPVEIQDNGGEVNPLSLMIGAMNPTWDEAPSKGGEYFEKAVEVFSALIKREQERESSALKGESIIKDALATMRKEGKKFAVLEQFAPWQKILVPTEALFVIFPSNRGGWNIQTIPFELGGRESKQILPPQEEMEGCSFRHPAGFIASFSTREEATSAAEKITE